MEEYTSELALRMTEVYEYALSLSGSKVQIPHLQICKVLVIVPSSSNFLLINCYSFVTVSLCCIIG